MSFSRHTTRPRILVVDDNPDNRDMYSTYLEYTGFAVDVAGDGVSALSKATAVHPDLIVMDLSLPRMDGWETTRRIKADAGTRQIPVLALTGHALDESEKHARSAGCDSYLTKPCLPQELVLEIRRLLSLPKLG
jgi:two-component system cell cycle response regulator DivK